MYGPGKSDNLLSFNCFKCNLAQASNCFLETLFPNISLIDVIDEVKDSTASSSGVGGGCSCCSSSLSSSSSSSISSSFSSSYDSSVGSSSPLSLGSGSSPPFPIPLVRPALVSLGGCDFLSSPDFLSLFVVVVC